MSLVLTVAAVGFVGLCIYATRRYAVDNRGGPTPHNSLRAFVADFVSVISDRHACYVYCFFCIAGLGMMFVGTVEMFTYVDFMRLTYVHKAITEGMGMIACALGALLQTLLVARYDKKQAGYIGVTISVFGGLMLFILFIGGILCPEQTWIIPAGMPLIGGLVMPIAVLVFAFFLALWWCGIGVIGPLSMSMIADISEINYRGSGVLKDGSYSANFAFVTSVVLSLGTFISGWALESIGYVSGAATQSLEVSRNMAVLTFISGPIFVLLALPFLWKYPIDRAFMTRHSLDSHHGGLTTRSPGTAKVGHNSV